MIAAELPILDCRVGAGFCGACCGHLAAPPFGADELRAMPADERAAIDAMKTRSGAGPCPWLAPDGSCAQYARRPQVCRDFERGGSRCREARRMRGIA